MGVSDTQVIVALAVGVSVFIIFTCVAVIVVVRLRRLMKTQLEALNNLVSTLQSARGQSARGQTARGPDTPPEPPGE